MTRWDISERLWNRSVTLWNTILSLLFFSKHRIFNSSTPALVEQQLARRTELGRT